MPRLIPIASTALFILLHGCAQPTAQPPREEAAVLFAAWATTSAR